MKYLMQFKDHVFTIMCVLAVVLLFVASSLVMGGFLMGIMSTIGIWMFIKKFPKRVQGWIGKYPLLSDLVFLKLSFAVFMMIGSGPTIFMALMTQMVLLGTLLNTLHQQQKDDSDGFRVHDTTALVTIRSGTCG